MRKAIAGEEICVFHQSMVREVVEWIMEECLAGPLANRGTGERAEQVHCSWLSTYAPFHLLFLCCWSSILSLFHVILLFLLALVWSNPRYPFFFGCVELPTTRTLLPNGIQIGIYGEEDQKGFVKNATITYAWQVVSRHKVNLPKCPAGWTWTHSFGPTFCCRFERYPNITR